MKNCPTSNLNRSKFWGFEVSQILTAFVVLAGTNLFLNFLNWPLIFSWIAGLSTLLLLKVISHGQKNGHLELAALFVREPHVYLGHRDRERKITGKI